MDGIAAIFFKSNSSGTTFGVVLPNGEIQYIFPIYDLFFGFSGIKTRLFPPQFYSGPSSSPAKPPQYTQLSMNI